MPKKQPTHIHKYRKMDLSRKETIYLVFKCVEIDCSSYIPVKTAEGKISRCNRCNEPFPMTKETLRHKYPHCNNCIKRVKGAEISKLTDLLDKIIP